MPLATVMVAPNGARRTKKDHPALPVSIAEIVECAAQCYAAGADGIHAHIRDKNGQHTLDAGLYSELLTELANTVPGMQAQITTEAVGRYTAAEQRSLVETLQPGFVSIALREIMEEPDLKTTQRFFAFCDEAKIAVQHILYEANEVDKLAAYLKSGVIKSRRLQVLHVLGRYTEGQVSQPTDLDPCLRRQQALLTDADWAVCAFGSNETACLTSAVQLGGKARIGFENNLLTMDGTQAKDNASRVAELITQIAGTRHAS